MVSDTVLLPQTHTNALSWKNKTSRHWKHWKFDNVKEAASGAPAETAENGFGVCQNFNSLVRACMCVCVYVLVSSVRILGGQKQRPRLPSIGSANEHQPAAHPNQNTPRDMEKSRVAAGTHTPGKWIVKGGLFLGHPGTASVCFGFPFRRLRRAITC